jgi:EpsI family protein
MPDRRTILVPVFLLAQAALVHWAAGRERAPAPPALESFPSALGEWRQVSEDPIAADVAGELRADRLLSRTYVNTALTTVNTSALHTSKPDASTNDASARPVVGLFVAWFQSQRAGASQPHSPKVCLPASGWIPAVTGVVTLDTAAGAITVNRYIVVNHGQRDVVLYWYQGPRRVTAGEWAAKFWLVADALRDRRTDTALVRVVAQSGDGGDRAATAAATGFARSLYPLLQESLPQENLPR